MNLQISVGGMTCANCVRHVTEALQEIPGVRKAVVDLSSATAQIESDREISRAEFAGALDEAGYTLA